MAKADEGPGGSEAESEPDPDYLYVMMIDFKAA